ncbi:hypothetical protein BX600DRAFT_18202 [Xylariales sp. PMI_506]|nr:hypothetical protein BX600DRAFT_18202 [Xylariales sp. PMI_506]
MPGERIVLDSLWRFLCPAIDTLTLSKALQAPVLPLRRRPSPNSRSQARCYGTLVGVQRRDGGTGGKISQIKKVKSTVGDRFGSDDSYARYIHRVWKRSPGLPLAIFDRQGSFDEALESIETDVLTESLRELVALEHQYHAICNIVRYLVTRRGRKPDVFLYECLIKANVDPKYGSAASVSNILKEMEAQRIIPTSAVYHGILDVLAVHPDYILRNRVLRDMKHAWQQPTFDGLISITAGLIRDGQYEIALNQLEELHRTGVPIPIWLYDVFVFTLAEAGAHEEVLMILQHRLRQSDTANVTNGIWSFLLDMFGRDAFYEGIKYVWDRVVIPGTLIPSDGAILSILNTASHKGDDIMAAGALQMLSNRGRKLGLYHFEPLLEAYVACNELRNAFLTVCVMANAGLKPDLSSVRPLYAALRTASSKTDEALATLHDLKLYHRIPMAAFNVVLEATIYHYGFEPALDLYRSVSGICTVDKPDIETYHILLEHCTMPRSMRFLLAEMEALLIKPDEKVYNRAIFISTLDDNYKQAFRYLEKMQTTQSDGCTNECWMNRDTALALIRRCIKERDGRAQELFQECNRRGFQVDESEVRTLADSAGIE